MIVSEAFNRNEEKSLNNSNMHQTYLKNDLMEKLYKKNKGTEKKTCENEKIINPLFIKADKCFVVYRNPLSPYITEKV